MLRVVFLQIDRKFPISALLHSTENLQQPEASLNKPLSHNLLYKSLKNYRSCAILCFSPKSVTSKFSPRFEKEKPSSARLLHLNNLPKLS